jgi:hypothetical protein
MPPYISPVSSRSPGLKEQAPAQLRNPFTFSAFSTRWRQVFSAGRRTRRNGALCGALALTMLGGVREAVASTVTVTITGTVFSGEDYSGVFGFAPSTDLHGQPFSLVYTFDDTKGAQITNTYGSVVCHTSIVNTPTSNPGTAVLKIGSGTWNLFGTLPGGKASSYATLSDGCGDKSGSVEIAFDVTDVAPYNQGNGDMVGGNVIAVDPTLVGDNTWEYAFTNSKLSPSGMGFDVSFRSTPASTLQSAQGNLIPATITVSGPSPAGLQFVPVTPCRVADTRSTSGPFGGPKLGGGATREFDIPQSACSIPASAAAYALNVTAVPDGSLGYLTIWPAGQPQPTASTLNSDGRYKANAAIVPAGANGGVNVFVSDPSQVVLDISGYFAPAGTSSALAFYPLTPCRLVDTRIANGPLGGPTLAAGSTREFPLRSACNLPSAAAAYSLNVTAIPQGALPYLTIWPSGQSQPAVSTLNAPTGTVAANAAIVPAGSNGDVTVYVAGTSDVAIDVNGYFAAPGAGGLSLYATTPCRVLDTRSAAGPFTGVLSVNVESSTCAPPSSAQAYVVNATVVPSGSLGYLTLWPAGQTQPQVSTLNALDGVITSNAAIVPTVNGSINSFAANPTQLILDLFGYYAP